MDVNKKAPIFLAFARIYGMFESRVIPEGADILHVCLTWTLLYSGLPNLKIILLITLAVFPAHSRW